jgi:hypothetical protein
MLSIDQPIEIKRSDLTLDLGIAKLATSAQVSHHSPAVLILVDVINHFEFPDGRKVLRQALPIAPKLACLKTRAQAAGMSTI